MPNIKNQNEVKALVEKFKAMKGMILTEYHGLSVSEISELRSKLKKQDCEFAVVKNRLSAIALKELGIEAPKLTGPTAIVFENADTITPAKTVMDFAKDHAKLVVKAGYMDGNFVEADIVKAISALPSKEVLIGKMLGSMNAPISGFVNVLAANIRGLVTVLDAISKKQSAA
jgi:large subunit ribosomal protein L10